MMFGPIATIIVSTLPKLDDPEELIANESAADNEQQSTPIQDSSESLTSKESNSEANDICPTCGQVRDLGETICPLCRESIKVGALKCKHCGEVFSEPVAASQ